LQSADFIAIMHALLEGSMKKKANIDSRQSKTGVTPFRKAIIKTAIQNDYIASSSEGDYILNLRGKYDYMESPYFISQEMEAAGIEIHPTCREMLDAYITPILLEKARISDIPISSYYISNGYFEPPVIIDPINPFMIKSRTVWATNNLEKIARSMTRNFTYAICCQELPAGAIVKRFRSVLGWSTSRQFRDISSKIWDVFRIPLARVRIVMGANGEILLSDISHLPLEDLNEKELHHLMDKALWGK
jgi:hypothetical protein